MKKYFLTGLATLLPLALTIYIVLFVVRFLTHPFVGIMTNLLTRIPVHLPFVSVQILRTISQILILIGLVAFTVFLGLCARWFFLNGFVKLGDRLLGKIPLVNKVYKTSKDIIQTLFSTDQNSFKQVVMVPFPSKGSSYCLGLVTKKSPTTCSSQLQDEMLSVFIPTTPNPTSGYLIMSPKSELIFLEMKSEEAIKYVVSCGMIQPTSKEAS